MDNKDTSTPAVKLPEPAACVETGYRHTEGFYSAEQMQSHGEACRSAGVNEAIAALQEQIAQYRKDAERYRWLRNEANKVIEKAPIVVVADGDFDVSWKDARCDASLDDEIDARMRGEGNAN
jgi:Ribonuclease G/E